MILLKFFVKRNTDHSLTADGMNVMKTLYMIVVVIIVFFGAGCASNVNSPGGNATITISVGDPATMELVKSNNKRLDRIETAQVTQIPDREDPLYLQPSSTKRFKDDIRWGWKYVAVVTLVTIIIGGSVAVIGYNIQKSADGEF